MFWAANAKHRTKFIASVKKPEGLNNLNLMQLVN